MISNKFSVDKSPFCEAIDSPIFGFLGFRVRVGSLFMLGGGPEPYSHFAEAYIMLFFSLNFKNVLIV